MEEWVRTWLEERRKKGEKCLEIKYIQDKPYVYRSTSVYNKATKSPKKVSTYIGRLTKEHGLIAKGARERRIAGLPRSIHEYGNAALLAEEFHDLLPVLREAFPACWQEIVALTFTRVTGYIPLSRVGDTWEKLDNILDIQADCDPRTLSRVLTAVGGDRAGQQAVFQYLSSQARQLVYDLSFVFSYSDTVNLAEFGYNAESVWLPQVNIALFSATDTGLPVMIRVLPGSVRDVATLLRSLQEINITMNGTPLAPTPYLSGDLKFHPPGKVNGTFKVGNVISFASTGGRLLVVGKWEDGTEQIILDKNF